MKKHSLSLLAALMFTTTASFAQVNQIVGDWKTVDDKTGEN